MECEQTGEEANDLPGGRSVVAALEWGVSELKGIVRRSTHLANGHRGPDHVGQAELC